MRFLTYRQISLMFDSGFINSIWADLAFFQPEVALLWSLNFELHILTTTWTSTSKNLPIWPQMIPRLEIFGRKYLQFLRNSWSHNQTVPIGGRIPSDARTRQPGRSSSSWGSQKSSESLLPSHFIQLPTYTYLDLLIFFSLIDWVVIEC